MISEKPNKRFYWMAYLGAALAFETKGIPAAAFAGASMLYLVLNPWKKIKLKKLIEPYSIIIAILIALSWFIIMYSTHGVTYLESFFNDQIGGRVSSKITQVFKNGGLGIINLIAFFIPWILIAFSKPKQLKIYVTDSNKKLKSIFGFILMWVILIVLMSGAVFKFYDRYILPVVPLVAIFLSIIFVHSITGFKKTIITTLLVLNLIVLVISILYATFILADTILIVGIIISVSILILWLTGFFKTISNEIVIANGVLLLYFSVFIFLYPLLMPNPGKQMVNALKEQGISENTNVYVYGNIRAASNIRIHSKNNFNVIGMDTVYSLPKTPKHFLVFNEKEKDLLDLKNYRVFNGSEEWLRVPVEKFPSFMKGAIINIKKSGTRYFIAKPENQNNQNN